MYSLSLIFVGTHFQELWLMLHRQLIQIQDIYIRKPPYFLALLVANILYGIQIVNYIVVVGIAKLSVIEETDVQAMHGRKQPKRKTRNKRKPRYYALCRVW